jgi:hypothetical protein
MELRVDKVPSGLRVDIDGVAGHEQALLERIRACRQGAWACPSGECMNIGTMEEHAQEGHIVLMLAPRPGAQLSATGIEQCLRYTLQATSG